MVPHTAPLPSLPNALVALHALIGIHTSMSPVPVCGQDTPYFEFNVWVPNVGFDVRTYPDSTALRISDPRVEIINPHCLRQFSVGEKQIMKRLIGVWKIRAKQLFAPNQMKMVRIHKSKVLRR
jgi:hypothetical protein